MCQCLMLLEDASGIAEMLNKLIAGEEEQQLLAYQIAFALFENERAALFEQGARPGPR